MRTEPGTPARMLQTLEDTRFYGRSLPASGLFGEAVTSVHETLDLPRVVWLPGRLMLPRRMPRRGPAGSTPARHTGVAPGALRRVRSTPLDGRSPAENSRRWPMADQARVVYSYSTSVPDEPGQAFKVLATLVSAGVNLLGCSGTQNGSEARIDVVPADASAFAALAERAALNFRRQKAGFLIQGDDRPGALADNLSRLAAMGINVGGVHGLAAGAGRWSAIVWVADHDLEAAARALGTTVT